MHPLHVLVTLLVTVNALPCKTPRLKQSRDIPLSLRRLLWHLRYNLETTSEDVSRL